MEARAGDNYIKSVKITTKEKNEEQILIKKLVSGKINLYVGYSDEKGKIFFINQESDQELKAINKSQPAKFLKSYFPACPDLSFKIRFEYRSLYEAISQYNSCLYNSSELLVLEELPSRPRVGVSVEGIHSIQQHDIKGWHEKEDVRHSDRV